MLYRLVRPVKRSGSSFPQFVQRIPADVRARAVGRRLAIPLGAETVSLTVTPKVDAVRFSLRTRDPAEAKVRQGRAAAYRDTVWTALRQRTPLTLTHRQATALAGDLYRAWAEGEERVRTLAIIKTPSGWVRDSETIEEREAGYNSEAARMAARLEQSDAADLEPALGAIVDRLLMARGIAEVEPASREMLLQAFALALRDAFEARARNARGDYSPDAKAARFPEWQDPAAGRQEGGRSPRGGGGKGSLKALVEDWWAEAKAAGRKPSTYESYRNTFGRLVAFLKHDDASRVSPEDVIRFKDHRLASTHPRTGRPISAKTVKDSDLAGLKTVFQWAVANRRIASNPAKGLTLRVGKAPRLRSKGFTDAEAAAILSAAFHHRSSNEEPQTAAAKRWVPWLCAYTGARVGEVAQLRKQDLRKEGAHWVVRITPEAGTVKTNEARDVVLHPHLVEQGFPKFVTGAPAGHLFLRPGRDGDVRGPLRGLKNRLAEFARKVVPDPNVAPNHGWRHRFKTVGLEARVDHRVLDAIQGHRTRLDGETYGDVTVKAMAAAVRRMPRLAVD